MTPGFDYRRGCRSSTALSFILIGLLLSVPCSSPAVSDLEMTGFRINQETAGGRWEIRASQASYERQGAVMLNDVSARIVNAGVDRVKVVSDKGRYEPEGQTLFLEGNVFVSSVYGSRFTTSKLEWDGPGAVMRAEGGVHLERGWIRVSGGSVRYTVDTGVTQIKGNVVTTLDQRGLAN